MAMFASDAKRVAQRERWFDMDLDNLTPEQIEKAKTFKTTEDFIKFAMENGIELTDEQLEKVAGGGVWEDASYSEATCSSCGKRVTWTGGSDTPVMCPYCGHTFNWA